MDNTLIYVITCLLVGSLVDSSAIRSFPYPPPLEPKPFDTYGPPVIAESPAFVPEPAPAPVVVSAPVETYGPPSVAVVEEVKPVLLEDKPVIPSGAIIQSVEFTSPDIAVPAAPAIIPAPALPADTYGPPPELVLPTKPAEEYGPPPALVLPAKPAEEYGPPPAVIVEDHPEPVKVVESSYEFEIAHPAPVVELLPAAPVKPAEIYGPPPPLLPPPIPAEVYGPPPAVIVEDHPKPVEVIQSEYEYELPAPVVLPAKPAEIYGPPPALVVPAKPAEEYGPPPALVIPAKPAEEYGPPPAVIVADHPEPVKVIESSYEYEIAHPAPVVPILPAAPVKPAEIYGPPPVLHEEKPVYALPQQPFHLSGGNFFIVPCDTNLGLPSLGSLFPFPTLPAGSPAFPAPLPIAPAPILPAPAPIAPAVIEETKVAAAPVKTSYTYDLPANAPVFLPGIEQPAIIESIQPSVVVEQPNPLPEVVVNNAVIVEKTGPYAPAAPVVVEDKPLAIESKPYPPALPVGPYPPAVPVGPYPPAVPVGPYPPAVPVGPYPPALPVVANSPFPVGG